MMQIGGIALTFSVYFLLLFGLLNTGCSAQKNYPN